MLLMMDGRITSKRSLSSFIFFCSVHRLSVVFRIRIAYSNSTGQPGCNTKNNLTVEIRIQNRIVLKLNSNSAPKASSDFAVGI